MNCELMNGEFNIKLVLLSSSKQLTEKVGYLPRPNASAFTCSHVKC